MITYYLSTKIFSIEKKFPPVKDGMKMKNNRFSGFPIETAVELPVLLS